MFTSSSPRNRAHPQSSQSMEPNLARRCSGQQQPWTQACPTDHPKSLCTKWAGNIPPSSHKSKSDIGAVTAGTRRCSVPSPVVTGVQGDAWCYSQVGAGREGFAVWWRMLAPTACPSTLPAHPPEAQRSSYNPLQDPTGTGPHLPAATPSKPCSSTIRA